MAWAVVQTCESYHPEGDKTRTATEFAYWIHETRTEASRYKADLLLRYKFDRVIVVKEVPEEAWTPENLSKKKGK